MDFGDGTTLGDKILAGQRYWERQRGVAFLPSRADLDPDDIAWLLPLTFLIDVRYQPLDFRYRLLGTEIVRRSHGDYTGWSLRDLPQQRPPSRIWRLFEFAVERLRPHCDEIPYLPIPGRFVQAMAAPLSEDGRRVNMLFGVMQFDVGEAAPEARRKEATPTRLSGSGIHRDEVSGWLSPGRWIPLKTKSAQ